MKPTREIWVAILIATALCCWWFAPSSQPTRIGGVDTTDPVRYTFLLGSTKSQPANSTISGILADPQFRAVIRELERRETEKLPAPKRTTIPGRSINRVDEMPLTFVITNR